VQRKKWEGTIEAIPPEDKRIPRSRVPEAQHVIHFLIFNSLRLNPFHYQFVEKRSPTPSV
jgi:hypothetical protein